MGGKGQRRREKNFLAAHGGYTRLPPAPKVNDLDKLPSKLRRLMDFLSPSKTTSTKKLQVHLKTSKDAKIGKRKEDVIVDQNEHGFTAAEFNKKGNHENVKTLEHGSNRDTNTNMDKKGKRKRKRKAVDDLRFREIDQGSTTTGLSKRERRKKFLEERRKKHKKGKTDDSQDFPMREEIRFGEVVEAPPKIAAFPKAKKTTLGASQERLRLQAVEAYRKRKGWVSRPGIHLPPIAADQNYTLWHIKLSGQASPCTHFYWKNIYWKAGAPKYCLAVHQLTEIVICLIHTKRWPFTKVSFSPPGQQMSNSIDEFIYC